MKNCVNCGKENADEAVFCAGCGAPLEQAPVAEAPAAAPEPPAAPEEPAADAAPATADEPAPLQPVDASSYYTESPAPAAPAVSNKAMLWLILNIVGTVLCCLANVFTIIGIVFAAIGMSSYNKGDYEDMNKKAKIAMILFIVGMAAGALVLILSFAGLFVLPFAATGIYSSWS